jgi:hypothetical protein
MRACLGRIHTKIISRDARIGQLEKKLKDEGTALARKIHLIDRSGPELRFRFDGWRVLFCPVMCRGLCMSRGLRVERGRVSFGGMAPRFK